MGGRGLAMAGFVLGYLSLLVTFLILPGLLARAMARAQRINCVNNLKQVGLAFRVWSLEHQDRFPFNVPTQEGGTMEPGVDFEPNPARIFQVLSNELGNPVILVCPGDPSKRPALNFASLHDAKISYELRSGPKVNDRNPQAVLAHCPIHNNELLSDGSVQQRRMR